MVSSKKQWTYTDDAGKPGTRRRWRNSLESIESIDLRDSESQINKAYNEGKIETLGFRLASNKVTLEDSDGSLHSIYKTTAGSVLLLILLVGSIQSL